MILLMILRVYKMDPATFGFILATKIRTIKWNLEVHILIGVELVS